MSHFILLISSSTDHFYDMYLVMVSPLQQPRRLLSNDGVLPSISSTLVSSEAVQPSVVKNSKGSCSKAFRLTISTPQSILGSLFTHDEISSPVPFFCDGVHCFENATPPELLPSRACRTIRLTHRRQAAIPSDCVGCSEVAGSVSFFGHWCEALVVDGPLKLSQHAASCKL